MAPSLIQTGAGILYNEPAPWLSQVSGDHGATPEALASASRPANWGALAGNDQPPNGPDGLKSEDDRQEESPAQAAEAAVVPAWGLLPSVNFAQKREESLPGLGQFGLQIMGTRGSYDGAIGFWHRSVDKSVVTDRTVATYHLEVKDIVRPGEPGLFLSTPLGITSTTQEALLKVKSLAYGIPAIKMWVPVVEMQALTKQNPRNTANSYTFYAGRDFLAKCLDEHNRTHYAKKRRRRCRNEDTSSISYTGSLPASPVEAKTSSDNHRSNARATVIGAAQPHQFTVSDNSYHALAAVPYTAAISHDRPEHLATTHRAASWDAASSQDYTNAWSEPVNNISTDLTSIDALSDFIDFGLAPCDEPATDEGLINPKDNVEAFDGDF